MGAIPKADRHCQLSARAGAQVRPLIARVLADEHGLKDAAQLAGRPHLGTQRKPVNGTSSGEAVYS